MAVSRGDDRVSFSEAIRSAAERRPALGRRGGFSRVLITRGLYAPQMRRLFSLFPARNVLVLQSEKFAARPGETLAEVCDYLGVAAFGFRLRPPLTTRASEVAIDPTDEAYLREIYAPDVRELEALLGRKFEGWSV